MKTNQIKSLNELGVHTDYISVIQVDKFYGRNYITDLALSTIYSDAGIITKGSFYNTSEGILTLKNKELRYTTVEEFEANRSLINEALC